MTMEIHDTITNHPSSISEHQKTKSSQDAMRTRVRLFTEGVLKMVSPVLLALALYKKVDFKGEGTWFVRGSISPIAAVTMAFGILLTVLLWLCLWNLVARLEWLQDAASKLLVHLCAILLMCLALRVRGDGRDNDDAHANECYDWDLEFSVDFSAAFTTLLFLGLERLALEVHLTSNREGGMAHHHLEYCLGVNFIACLIGVVIMLVWTIPPSAENDIDGMRTCIKACNVALALSIAGIVLWITWAQLNADALWVIVPPFFSFVGWMCSICLGDEQANGRDSTQPGDEQPQGEPHLSVKVEDNGRNSKVPSPPDTSEVKLVKPPSLELTKLALLGFFAVSIPSISDSSHNSSTHAFILLTAMSVVSALVWRLLGHRANPERAEITAANIASIFAHGLAIAALVPFAVMAHMNARFIVTPHSPRD